MPCFVKGLSRTNVLFYLFQPFVYNVFVCHSLLFMCAKIQSNL